MSISKIVDPTAEEQHQKDLERLAQLRPIDDDLMREMFRGNMPLAQLVLRIFTGIDDLVLTEEKTQYDLKHLLGARSICLDVFASDSNGVKYDLEIQRADKGASPKRARYHSSSMDIEFLAAGDDFDELPVTYTIFITENDVRGEGRAAYLFERRDTLTNKPLGDEEYILMINGAYNDREDDSDLARLIHDFGCTKPSDMYFTEMAESAHKYKETPEGVSHMCKIIEDMREEAREQGRIEGKAEGKIEGRIEGKIEGRIEGALSTLIDLVKKGLLTPAQAAEQTDMTVDEFGAVMDSRA